MPWLTVGLTPHRLEFLPETIRLMEGHEVIVLEEPPEAGFREMLRGELEIERYVEESEAGFPEYAKAACREFQRLYARGKTFCQIEPYLERWITIRRLLDEGLSAEKVRRLPDLARVYEMEHETFGKLLDYYAAMGGDFETLVTKIKDFARADARRIALRDEMRAEEILKCLRRLSPSSVYVEAGYIHIKLVYLLARGLPSGWKLRVKNLLLEATKARGLSRFLPSPGDGLTSYYLFAGRHREIDEDLLAARSLVYIKLIEKDELKPSEEEPFPHLTNELFWRLFVGELSYEDCRQLDRVIRLLPTEKARQAAAGLFPAAYRAAGERLRKKLSGVVSEGAR
ncbi:MAG: hypothetical protein GXO17_06780 [Thermodesulfobacteria bacterium]|nr:hypothetical protein [Thermodesulfobacteriota bacterium]